MLDYIMKMGRPMTPAVEDAVSLLTSSIEMYRMRKAGVDTSYDINLAWESVIEDASKVVSTGYISRICMAQLLEKERLRSPNVEEALGYAAAFEEAKWDEEDSADDEY